MTAPVRLLCDGFDAVPLSAWRAAVEKALKGASADSLIRLTDEGLPVQPLYVAGDHPIAPQPGRGQIPEHQPWDICVPVRAANPDDANAQALDALQGGASALRLHLDPTGQNGIAALSADDLGRVLRGVHLDIAPIMIDAGAYSAHVLQLWSTVATAGARPLTLLADPLGDLAQRGHSDGPVMAQIIQLATMGQGLAQAGGRVLCADGTWVHNGGGHAVHELAVICASAVTYVRALIRAGLPAQTALAAVSLRLSTDQRYFESIAKLRALRRLWANICAAFDADVPAHVLADGSTRMLCVSDIHNNLLRLTAATFAAACGGADSIALPPYSAPLGADSPAIRRATRNIQLVAMLESHLGAVADPAAGSWFMEDLTDQLARAAWAQFQAFEAMGGLLAVLKAGTLAEMLTTARHDLKTAMSDKRLSLLGVTDFKPTAPVSLDTQPTRPHSCTPPDVRLPGPDDHAPAITALRLEDLA